MLLVTVVIGAKAEEAVISYEGTSANSITVNGFTLTIGKSGKNWGGGGKMTINKKEYVSLKNSNGAKNTLTAPAGKVITGVTFYVTAHVEGTTTARLSDFEGESCSDAVITSRQFDTSLCDVIVKTLAKPANTVTFTFSDGQVNFVALVTYEDAAADYVDTPVISVSGATVTLTCATEGAKLYYTTDGTEPTAESAEYSSPITMTESATVRAIAVKGENVSDKVVKDVYVAGVGYIAKLGLASGTLNEAKNVWTSHDGRFTLTDNTAGREIQYTDIASSQDGFKLNHNDDYVLQPAADVKVTKIVVVGKTWIKGDAGNASTISIEGFTPESGSFIDYLTGGTSYVKTLTFTADGTVDYGTAIPMNIDNNQLGAYFEVYGEVKPIGDAKVTWNLQVNKDETTVTTTSVSASRPSITDVTKLALNGLTVESGKRDVATNKITTTAEKNANKYISMTFKVADGYVFTPSNVNFGIVAVSEDKTIDVEISDATTSASSSAVIPWNSDPAPTNFAFEGNSFAGTVTVKIYGYGGTSGYRMGSAIVLTGEVYQTATTYNNGWVSFTPSVDCAVTTENAAAYVATSVGGNNVTMTKVNDMKAGNGYFLYAGASEAKTLVVKGVEEATAPAENLLKGCTTDTEIDGSANSIYCLGKLNGTAGLYKVSTTLTVPAGKAYLQAPGSVKVKALNLVFSDSSEATAVKSINAQVEKNEAAVGTKHLLNGQIVIKTQNGFVNPMGVKVK